MGNRWRSVLETWMKAFLAGYQATITGYYTPSEPDDITRDGYSQDRCSRAEGFVADLARDINPFTTFF